MLVSVASLNAFAISVGFRFGALAGAVFTGTLSLLSSILVYGIIFRWKQASTGFRISTLGMFFAMTTAMFFPDFVIPRMMRYIAEDDRAAQQFFNELDTTLYPNFRFRYVNPAREGYRGAGHIVITGTAKSNSDLEQLVEELRSKTTLWVTHDVKIGPSP